jgi:hypothetical protein
LKPRLLAGFLIFNTKSIFMAFVDTSRIPDYYHKYVQQVSHLDLAAALAYRREVLLPLLRSLPDEQWNFAYAPGKWTIKELILHLIDAERIFSYRALRFARHDATPLASFDENDYARYCEAEHRSPASILEELEAALTNTDTLFNNFSGDQLDQEGVASNNKVYVRGIGYIICGHIVHHANVLKERYLQPATV